MVPQSIEEVRKNIDQSVREGLSNAGLEHILVGSQPILVTDYKYNVEVAVQCSPECLPRRNEIKEILARVGSEAYLALKETDVGSLLVESTPQNGGYVLRAIMVARYAPITAEDCITIFSSEGHQVH